MEQSFSNGNMRTLQGMILGCLILAALYMVGILLLLNERMVSAAKIPPADPAICEETSATFRNL